MPITIITIPLALPFKVGHVNCYLIRTGDSNILIDTGVSGQRGALENALEGAGCRPGDLKLIVITHGDFDHTGNAAHLRQKYAAKIGMHPDDWGMAERGDMFWNRKSGKGLFKLIASAFFRLRESDRFTPDVALEEGFDLREYGLDARVLSIPGHSQGSIGILTSDGDLFCGDLFENSGRPTLNSIMDDLTTATASLERLERLPVKTIYPGHGRPFTLGELVEQPPPGKDRLA
jgi:glyoxylase-like metal-dependent hydrolase (beta-lactamase superfamily II)